MFLREGGGSRIQRIRINSENKDKQKGWNEEFDDLTFLNHLIIQDLSLNDQ